MNNFHITRKAFIDLQEIYNYSTKNWGELKTDEYIDNIYQLFNKLANNPDLGELRKNRSTPFLMYPCNSHYIIYEPFQDGIIILTVLHKVRNIENIIQEFGSVFINEINVLKSNLNKIR